MKIREGFFLFLIWIISALGSMECYGQRVISTSPDKNSISVSRNTDIEVTFDQKLATNINWEEIFVVRSSINGYIYGEYLYNDSLNTMIFQPSTNFRSGEKISVTIASSDIFTSGDTVDNYNWSFRIKTISGNDKYDFHHSINYSKWGTGYSSTWITSCDIDSDNDLDFLINSVTYEDDVSYINILFNDSYGFFDKHTSIKIEEKPWNFVRSFSTGDINNDGHIDLVVPFLDNMIIYQNNGKGDFTKISEFNIPNRCSGECLLNDFNNDCFLDLIVPTNNMIYLYLNNGEGNYVLFDQVQSGDMSDVASIDAGDLDGDGDVDIITNNMLILNESGYLSVKNDSLSKIFPNSDRVRDIILEDMNNDKLLDIIISSNSWPDRSSSLLDRILVYLNNGDYTFTISDKSSDTSNTSDKIETGSSGHIEVLDYNKDGNLDIITIIDNDQKLIFGSGDGLGGVQDTSIIESGTINSSSFCSGDFDNDGDLDLITCDKDIYENVSNGLDYPQNFQSNKLNNQSIEITWDPIPGQKPYKYNIYRKIYPYTSIKLIDSVITENSYIDSNVIPGFNYNHYISAVDENGDESALSDWDSTTIQPPTENVFRLEGTDSGKISAGITLLGNNTMYSPISGDRVYRFDTTGTIEYTLNVNGEVKSSTTITLDHNVYIASTDNNLYSFNSNGVSNSGWPVALGSEATASVAIDNENNVYIGTHNGIYQAISSQGDVLWSYNVGASVFSSSVISKQNILYVINVNGRIYAFDLNNLDNNSPEYKWRLETNSTVKTSPALDGLGNIYITTESGKLIKVNDKGTSGKIDWVFNSNEPIETSPVIDANYNIYFGNNGNKLYSICGQTGELNWEISTINPVKSTPTISDKYNRMYVGVRNYIYSVSLNHGKVIYVYKASYNHIHCPILFDNKKIYYGSDAGGNWPEIIVFKDNSLDTTLSKTVSRMSIWPTFQGNKRRTGNYSDNPSDINYDPTNERKLKYNLCQNYPNPFNSKTTIKYTIPKNSTVEINIYNIKGKLEKKIYDSYKSSGTHSLEWDSKNFSSGVYFYRIQTGDFTDVKKCVLMK